LGAIANVIQAIYNAIAFFIEQASQIQALVNAVKDSIGNIAAGQVGAATNYIESALARSLSVAINFLARQVGLGNVGQKVRDIIKRAQDKIDAAMNKLIEYVAQQGNSWLLAKAGGGKARGGNRGDRSSATQQKRPNPVGQNNQRVVPNNRPNPQQRQPSSVTPNNRKPTPNHRQNPQQKTPIPVQPNNRKPSPTTVPAPANRNKPSGDRPSQNQQQTPALASYDRQIGKEVRFKADDENHRLWFEMQQSKPVLMVASAKQHLETFLNSQQVKPPSTSRRILSRS
jgi:hypothetical protein